MTRWPVKNKIIPSAAAVLSLFLTAVAANVLPAVLLRAARDLEASAEVLAESGTFQFLGFFCATITAAIMADYKGMKAVLTAGGAFSAVGAFVWALSVDVGTAWTGAALLGMGGGIFEGMSSVLLAHLFTHKRKLVLNLSQIFFCVGAVGGPWLLGYLLPMGVSWRWFFVGIGGASLLLAVLYLCSRLPKVAPEDQIDVSKFVVMIKRFDFWVPCVAIFLYVLAEASMILYCNLYLQRFFAAPEQWAVRSIGLIWGAMGIGRLLCAFIPEDRSYKRTVSALFFAVGVSLCAQMFVQSWPLSIALFVLAGFFCSGIWPLIVGLTAIQHRQCSSTAIGLVVATGALGAAAAPPFMNALLARVPSEKLFVAVGMVAFAGAIVVMLAPRRR